MSHGFSAPRVREIREAAQNLRVALERAANSLDPDPRTVQLRRAQGEGRRIDAELEVDPEADEIWQLVLVYESARAAVMDIDPDRRQPLMVKVREAAERLHRLLR